MKTLAVIKNELFKDFLKIVSTDDLAKTLDNPDVPLPYECLDSVENNNSDILATQLAQYFNQAKLPNKDFYRLDETQSSQLSFMLNLIKVSSQGQPSTIVRTGKLPENATHLDNLDNFPIKEPVIVIEEESSSTMPSAEFVTEAPAVLQESIPEAHFEDPVTQDSEEAPIAIKNGLRRLPEEVKTGEVENPEATSFIGNDNTVVENVSPIITYEAPIEYVYDEIPTTATTEVINPVDQIVTSDDIHDIAPIDEDDPFKFTPSEPVKKETSEAPVVNAIVSETPVSENNETVASFGIAKGAELNFFKKPEITATLVDDNNVELAGNVLTFNEAAKLAFKKAGGVGLANGLNNWLFQGKTLKQLKEEQS